MRLNPCDAPFPDRFAPDCLRRAFLGGAQGQQATLLRLSGGFRAACFVHALGRHAFYLHACARRVRRARSAMLATGVCCRRPFYGVRALLIFCCAFLRVCVACGAGMLGIAQHSAAHSRCVN